MGFSRQEYWSGLPCLPPGGLPNPGFKLGSPALQADSLPSEPPGKHVSPHFLYSVTDAIWQFSVFFSPLCDVTFHLGSGTILLLLLFTFFLLQAQGST